MNAELNTEPRSPNRAYNARFSEFLSSRRGKMFGVVEVVALAGSCFVLVLVLLSYLYFLVPARSRVASLNADRKQLQIVERVSIEVDSSEEAEKYLRTKKEKLGHLLDLAYERRAGD